MTYDEYVAALQTLLAKEDVNGQAQLNAILPRAIDYAELKIYRDPDLDFLSTRTSDSSAIATPGIRSVPIPSQFIIVENASIISPANATASAGTRIPMLRVKRDFIDFIWPQESLTKAPSIGETYYAIYNLQVPAPSDSDEPMNLPSSLLIAPTLDAGYRIEITGTYRPAALSATNPSTFLSLYLPDLYLAASMLFLTGWQRDWGAQADDPKMAVSWLQQYEDLKHGAATEEARKKMMLTAPHPPGA